MGRPKINIDLMDKALLSKVKISGIPYARIEKECDIPTNSLKYYVNTGHIPMKYRDNLKKYFKFIASKLI